MTKKTIPTGPVSVDSDITPISKQPIKQVDSNNWSDMSITELHEQRSVINSRLDYAKQLGHTSMAQQIARGLLSIDQFIASKSSHTDDERLI